MIIKGKMGWYEIVSKLGAGGMATVYRAFYHSDYGLIKDCAVKVLLPAWSENEEFVQMFMDEARCLVYLSHDNIVGLIELSRDGPTVFMAIEYVEGVNLRELFMKFCEPKVEFPLKYRLFIMMEIVRALDYAHSKIDWDDKPMNIVHRDISPQNILLSFGGAVRVADFGIAKGTHRNYATRVENIKGKFSYMSPEQAAGQPVDARTDIFSTGILLYEVLSGKRLFDSPNDLKTLEMVRQWKPDSLKWGDLDFMLQKIVRKALQKDLDRRYQQSAKFLADLHDYATETGNLTNNMELGGILRSVFQELIAQRRQNTPTPTIKPDFSKRLTPEIALSQAHETKVLPTSQVDDTVAEKRAEPWYTRTSVIVGGGIAAIALLTWAMWIMWKAPMLEERKTTQAGAPSRGISHIPKSLDVRGSIWIDSIPTNTRANVKVGDKIQEVETPFVAHEIDLVEDVPVELRLDASGYKPVEQKYVLSEAEPTLVKTFVLEKILPGILNIQARPWGYAYIPGILSGKETPIAGLSLPPGNHKVRVHYQPKDLWVEGEVSISSGQRKTCLAQFDPVVELKCH